MKSMRSQLGLVLFGVGALGLFSGCVIKTTTDDSGTGGATGSSSGSGSATSSTGSGTTSATGSVTGSGSATVTGSGTGGASTTSGGTGGSSGGSGGSGGSGTGGWMDSGIKDASGDAWQDGGGIDSCDNCLLMQCSKEIQDCFDDPMCFTGDPQDPGQYERVINCVEQRRTMAAVKRQDLRNCGLVAVPGFGWPPADMADTTTNLINCMATGQTMVPMNNSWADPQNFSQPWPANSCAKLACTSMVQ